MHRNRKQRGTVERLGVTVGFCEVPADRNLPISTMMNPEEKGIIGEVEEGGFPVVFKFVDELPSEETRGRFGWLTVVSWKYDGSQRNGMPPEETNSYMRSLEHAIEDNLESKGYCQHAYSRTGNSLKELVYYISDREQFMKAFNNALRDRPRYPLEINFYEDRAWEDFQKILEMFRQAK